LNRTEGGTVRIPLTVAQSRYILEKAVEEALKNSSTIDAKKASRMKAMKAKFDCLITFIVTFEAHHKKYAKYLTWANLMKTEFFGRTLCRALFLQSCSVIPSDFRSYISRMTYGGQPRSTVQKLIDYRLACVSRVGLLLKDRVDTDAVVFDSKGSITKLEKGDIEMQMQGVIGSEADVLIDGMIKLSELDTLTCIKGAFPLNPAVIKEALSSVNKKELDPWVLQRCLWYCTIADGLRGKVILEIAAKKGGQVLGRARRDKDLESRSDIKDEEKKEGIEGKVKRVDTEQYIKIYKRDNQIIDPVYLNPHKFCYRFDKASGYGQKLRVAIGAITFLHTVCDSYRQFLFSNYQPKTERVNLKSKTQKDITTTLVEEEFTVDFASYFSDIISYSDPEGEEEAEAIESTGEEQPSAPE
jgi:hypothetical protein